jgi:CubicO group peptidase (beta-lactamase class C family)
MRGAFFVCLAVALAGCGPSAEPASSPSLSPPAPVAAIAKPPPAPAAAPGADGLAASIASIVAKANGGGDDPRAPGCAVGVFRAGEIVFAQGYGLASLENDVAITPRTSFEIGSMSKQFTATAILLLVEDGKLRLDDDVRKYIPELPDYGHPLTLRELLHHTGGLREYDLLLDLSGWDVIDAANDDEALRLVTMQRGTNFVPGTEWSYSNTGYFLLSQVVKRVSGKSLAVFSKERIFAPLGMKDTSILDDPTAIIARRATGYAPHEGGGFQVAASARAVTGEGNVQSTILDLARWDANFYPPGNRVGGRAWLEAMRTPGKRADGTLVPYAMGLVPKTVHGLAEESHSGGWAGYLADWRRYPSERLSVAVLCNRADVNPIALTKAVAAKLVPALAGGESSASPSTPSPAAAPSGPALETFRGAYVEPRGLVVRTFDVKDGVLQLGASLTPDPSAPPRPLERIDAASFRVPGAPSTWTFAPERVTRVAPGEPSMTFERFAPQTLTPAQLGEYVGRYESPETTLDLEVALVDGKLIAAPWGKRHLAEKLTPLGRDTFTSDGEYGLVFHRAGGGAGSGHKVVEAVAVADGYHAVRWKKR